ncbi:MAG: hypothetical protein KJZ92_01035 [Rhodocyclaceae bacterium]|nr:hypothetical protein [Rhodocyclaceae bacterium]MCL4679826.1 hypothetical protein [Rhodocyclaceae bacterium]
MQGESAMNQKQTAVPSNSQNQPEMAALLLGAGFALASLILLPAVAQRIGMGSSLTIALRGALMRAANRF